MYMVDAYRVFIEEADGKQTVTMGIIDVIERC